MFAWLCEVQEEQAMQAIRKVVGDPLGMELYELWKEYEELQTVEAIYCKAPREGLTMV